ncbi:topless-related protein 4 [Morus notabilis]|uniref:topless-related protein 4 n=1 Tax=Morus notabilis TaxID=981085 RepID=UPI000CED39A0|nr:topless-related protein 4 [Morus notabilis]
MADDIESSGVGDQRREIKEEAPQNLEKNYEVLFDEKHFEACVTNGEWDKVEKYLSGFVKIDQESMSVLVFFEIRKQKYFEALERKDFPNAMDILKKDLKFFARYDQDLFKELTMLLTLDDFRENGKLSTYGNAESARAGLLRTLKQKSANYASLCRKPEFCNSDNSKQTTPVNQSYGNNPMANPLVGPGGSYVPPPASPVMPMMQTQYSNLIASAFSTANPLAGFNTTIPAPASLMMPMMSMQNTYLIASVPVSIPNLSSNPTFPFQPALAFPKIRVGGFMPGPSSVPHKAVTAQPSNLNAPAIEVRGPPHKRRRLAGTVEKVDSSAVNVSPEMYHDALPQTTIVEFYQGTHFLSHNNYFYQGSQVQSLDFHPLQQTLLLVGSANGDISIWDMGETEWLVCQPFEIWDIGACSLSVQTSFSGDQTASVNRVIWNPDGDFFGVAYSKHLVHIYSYNADFLTKYIEIDAHFGNVYDISFSNQSKSLCIITCGEDNAIRMWMALTDERFSLVYNFVGHEAPVYSVCPYEDGKQYLFSVDTNGKIHAWIYGTKLFTCDACPSWGRMARSADGTRLFFCGTVSNGDSYLVEWDHKEGGGVKRMYRGLRRRSAGVVQFDTANNRILAAGDEFQVKFWNMDCVKQLSYSFATGGLPSRPCVRFNKGGTLLAVSTLEDGIKVLANAGGLQLLRSMEKSPVTSRKRPLDVIASGLATATHDEVVGGSPGFGSREQQSPGFGSFDQ